MVEYGTKTDPHQLLIDAGTFHSWDGVRKELMRRRKDRYEIFVVTHIDEDHIGGAIAAARRPDLKQRIDHVWFNGYVHCESGGNVLGPVNGEQLTTRIVEGGFRWNQGFTPKASNDVGGPVVVPSCGRAALPSTFRGTRVLVFLSPSGPKLKTMAKTWNEVVEKAGLVPGHGDAGHTTSPKPRDRDVRPAARSARPRALTVLAAEHAIDGSAANATRVSPSSSSSTDKRVLFGADAHAPVLTKASEALRGAGRRGATALRPRQAGPPRQQRQHLRRRCWR